MQLALSKDRGPITAPISPRLEMGAYEALWLREGAWFTNIAEKFAAHPEALPSDFVSRTEAAERADAAEFCAKVIGIPARRSQLDRGRLRQLLVIGEDLGGSGGWYWRTGTPATASNRPNQQDQTNQKT